MTTLFGRDYKLIIKSSMGGEDLVYEPPMQIKFSVSLTPSDHVMIADITVYGVSKENRERLYREYDEIALYAGYVGNVGLIFRGGINNVETAKDNKSTYIKFYSWSHHDKWKGASINKTWGRNTPPIEIIRDVANTFGINVEIMGDFSQLPLSPYGETRVGKSVEEMNKLQKTHGFEWFFESNRIVIAKNNASREKVTHTVNADNGMEGTPRVSLKNIDVDVKLDHRIRIFDWVDITSMFETYSFRKMESGDDIRALKRKAKSGKYAVQSVSHQGDFYGNSWKTAISALLPAAPQEVINE